MVGREPVSDLTTTYPKSVAAKQKSVAAKQKSVAAKPKPKPKPVAAKPKPKPVAAKPKPKPVAAKPKPKPKPKPVAAKPKPKPKPKPVAAKPKPKPKPVAAKPAAKAKPVHEVMPDTAPAKKTRWSRFGILVGITLCAVALGITAIVLKRTFRTSPPVHMKAFTTAQEDIDEAIGIQSSTNDLTNDLMGNIKVALYYRHLDDLEESRVRKIAMINVISTLTGNAIQITYSLLIGLVDGSLARLKDAPYLEEAQMVKLAMYAVQLMEDNRINSEQLVIVLDRLMPFIGSSGPTWALLDVARKTLETKTLRK